MPIPHPIDGEALYDTKGSRCVAHRARASILLWWPLLGAL